MRKIKRRIKVGDQSFDIWLGLSKKAAGKMNLIKLHYYPGDPNTTPMKAVAIKAGFKSEEEAIDYGKKFMIDLYKNALRRKENKA